MDILSALQGFGKFFTFLTDKGILIRIGTVSVGVAMVTIGVMGLLRKPIGEAVGTVASVAGKVPV